MPDDACPDTYHVERHDNHEVDADASAGGGKLPVLLHKIPFERSELLHCNETENHHSKHSCQDEGNLNRGMVERKRQRGGGDVCVMIYAFKNVISTDKHSSLACRGFFLSYLTVQHKKGKHVD